MHLVEKKFFFFGRFGCQFTNIKEKSKRLHHIKSFPSCIYSSNGRYIYMHSLKTKKQQ